MGSSACSSGGIFRLPLTAFGLTPVSYTHLINFLRAITTDKAYAVAKVIKRGKQLLVMDVEAFNEGSDKVAAKMIFTGTPTQG